MTDSNTTSLPSKNDEPKATPPPAKKKKLPPKKAGKSTPWLLILLICVLAGLSSACFIYLWQITEQQKQAISYLQEDNTVLVKQISSSSGTADQQIKKLENKIEQQQALIDTLDKLALFNAKELNRLHASNRIDWLLAEAEYLLRLANQRLNIENDILGAENILIAADTVLSEADDPSLYSIRKAMASEIMALQAITKLDHEGAYLKIQALIVQLEKMNERHFIGQDDEVEVTQKTEQDYEYKTLWREIWRDLKTAVVIRRMDKPVPALLAPEQSYYLKQNLRLMLEQAGSALLQKEEQQYQIAIDKAKYWIQNYFVQNSSETQALLSALNHLRIVKVTQEKPDISESLRLLKARLEVMYRQHQLSRQPAAMPAPKETKKIEQPTPSTPQPNTQPNVQPATSEQEQLPL